MPKANLKPTGSSRYWVLQPGHTATYAAPNGETLTITVLDETREVDGVTTRVVEEREEEGGQLVEVSRNFLAIDPATGDVYYFGEDVDMYKGGELTTHEGAWLAGRKDARFGLLMPGSPTVGRRHYQEIAPKVAMDRAEIVSLSERVETPAGVFENCVKVKESTPLERGSEYKFYAPGVGLIKDADLTLTSYSPRRP